MKINAIISLIVEYDIRELYVVNRYLLKFIPVISIRNTEAVIITMPIFAFDLISSVIAAKPAVMNKISISINHHRF